MTKTVSQIRWEKKLLPRFLKEWNVHQLQKQFDLHNWELGKNFHAL